MPPQTALPKYVQIAELLIREIRAGRFQPGDRLPPERVLAADLGIAVGTLRKALEDLQAKGAIERRHGSGNYVQPSEDVPSIYGFFRLETPQGGGLPTARVLSVDHLPKPGDLPDFGPGAMGWRIRRIRALDGVDVAAEEIWLDGRFARRLSAADLGESLYLHYRERMGLWILRVTDRVGVAPAPDWAAPCGLGAGQAAGEVRRESWDQHEARAEVSITWFNPERARFVSRLR